MEFAILVHSHLRTSTRGRDFSEKMPNGTPGLNWTSQYGYVYLDGNGEDAAVDGMNEYGLSYEALYLPGITQYQTQENNVGKKGVSYLHLGDGFLVTSKPLKKLRLPW